MRRFVKPADEDELADDDLDVDQLDDLCGFVGAVMGGRGPGLRCREHDLLPQEH
jgi:hypothetical protein